MRLDTSSYPIITEVPWISVTNVLTEMTRSLERLGTAIDNTLWLLEQPSGGKSEVSAALLADAQRTMEDFETAMCDDFNTALASAAMFELAKKSQYLYERSIDERRTGRQCRPFGSKAYF